LTKGKNPEIFTSGDPTQEGSWSKKDQTKKTKKVQNTKEIPRNTKLSPWPEGK